MQREDGAFLSGKTLLETNGFALKKWPFIPFKETHLSAKMLVSGEGRFDKIGRWCVFFSQEGVTKGAFFLRTVNL